LRSPWFRAVLLAIPESEFAAKPLVNRSDIRAALTRAMKAAAALSTQVWCCSIGRSLRVLADARSDPERYPQLK